MDMNKGTFLRESQNAKINYFRKGFTIVELMVVTAIFSGIVVIIFAILTGGRGAWLNSEAQIDVSSSLRQSIRYITGELAQSAPSNTAIIFISASEDRITFFVPQSFTAGLVNWGNQIQYSLGGINGQQLLRTDLSSGEVKVIGNYITSMNFNQPAADSIEVVLISSRQSLRGDMVQQQLRSQITLRNR